MQIGRDVIPFKMEHAYDQPTAARQLMGILNYINDFSDRKLNYMHPTFDKKYSLIQLFFNCK